jgi:hypothetical protein
MWRSITTLCLVLACVLWSATAYADTASFAKQLKDNDDYRVRTQAALALGASGDEAAVGPLCTALAKDSNVSVRVAAAAALGKLASPRGAPCLQSAQGRESNSSVKTQIDKSLASLGGGSGGSVAAGTKYYVAIAVTNKTTRSAGEIENIVRGAIQAKLQAVAGYAVAPKSESPAAGGALIKSKNLKGFYLLATVEAPVYSASSVLQVIRLGVFTYPDKSLKANLTQRGELDVRGKDIEAENDLLKDGASKTAADFQKVINTL